MKALQFDTCCCCINLRTGALILGYLGVIGGIIMIGIGMAELLNKDGNIEKTPAVIGILILILLVISLVFHALLLSGVYQKKPSDVKAAWIYIIVYTLLVTFLELFNPDNRTAPGIFSLLGGLCLSIYLALCVRSYELALKEEGLSLPDQVGHA